MRIIAIANQKGGVGKTPTTVNVAFALARAGYTILLVDFDPQGSLSEYFLADQADIQEVTIYNALSDLQRIAPLSITPQIALLPAHDELAGAELELPSKVHGQKRLARVLRFYQADYDFCLIDCPPSLGILTINALASAHQVVIPVKTEISAERALKRIKNTIKDIQESDLNGGLTIWGILPTLYNTVKPQSGKTVKITIYPSHDQLDKLYDFMEAYRRKTGIKINQQDLIRRIIDVADINTVLP